MAKGILGRKVGMTQVFDQSGKAIPVTVIEAGPCHVLRVRTVERDGYEAVQLGFLDKPRRLASRSERGQVTQLGGKRSKRRAAVGAEPTPRAECEPKRFVREIRGQNDGASVGDQWTVEVLNGVASVDVVGTSKGHGYQGVMRRHGFSGQRATHGVKKVHRHPGGTGCSAFPSRVFKGTRMAGQHGNTRVTARNLKVVQVDPQNHLLVVQGAVPGPAGGYVIVSASNMVR